MAAFFVLVEEDEPTISAWAIRIANDKRERRCLMHGGAEGSGAPKGNKNALKHGLYTCEAGEERWRFRELIPDTRKALKELAW